MVRILRSIFLGIRMAVVEMGSHRLRSSLSMLGVMLGVASLVAMLTLIGGIDVYLNVKMGKWIGSIWIFGERDDLPDNQKIALSRSPGMHFSDGGYLEDNSAVVKTTTKEIDRWKEVTLAGIRDWAKIRGVLPQTLDKDMEYLRLDGGRWPTSEEYEQGKHVCVISWDVVERVTKQKTSAAGRGGVQFIGAKLLFDNQSFDVIGICAPKDTTFIPWQLRRSAIIPLETMRTYVSGADPDPGQVEVSVTDVKKVKAQALAVAQTLKDRHRGVQDFQYRTAEWLDNISGMLNNVSLLMTIISIISLLVGGLSIMNVMLSSISERIYEIGIRKALGATNLQLFVQFVAETATLSFFGGVVGMIIGLTPLLFKQAIMRSTDNAIEPTILPLHVVYVFLIIAAVGVVFGLYPAVRAARMNPIEALRYE